MKKILIVDDDKLIRALVKRTLMRKDVLILEANSGESAVEIAKAEIPQLIFMDVIMKGKIDGFEATRILKKHPPMKKSTIIMLTSRNNESDKKKGFKSGADDYLVKPFSPLDLSKKVEEIFG